MSYTPNNVGVYIAAYTGSLAGMAMSGRFIEGPGSTVITNYCAAAGAFAQEFDTLYGSGSDDTAHLDAINQACSAVWNGRSNPSLNSDPTFYAGVCNAIISYLTGLASYFAAQGISTGFSSQVEIIPSTLDLGTVNNGAPTAFVFTVMGVKVGDVVTVNPPITLDDNIAVIQYHVSADNAVQVILYNLSGAPIVVGSKTFLFGVVKAV